MESNFNMVALVVSLSAGIVGFVINEATLNEPVHSFNTVYYTNIKTKSVDFNWYGTCLEASNYANDQLLKKWKMSGIIPPTEFTCTRNPFSFTHKLNMTTADPKPDKQVKQEQEQKQKEKEDAEHKTEYWIKQQARIKQTKQIVDELIKP